MSALKYWLWLTELRGLKNQTRLALLRHFGTPEDVFYADAGEILLTEGITREQAAILEDHRLDTADRVLADCQRLNLRLLTIQDAEYPGRLKNIYDPPCLLYVKGRLPAFDEEVAVAVVGTRDATPYGISSAEKLGYGLTKGGAVVVSGLAKGIDAAATRGALRAGGVTVGVVGNGLDVHYPFESRYLYAALGVRAGHGTGEKPFPRKEPHPLRPFSCHAGGGGPGAQRCPHHGRHRRGAGKGRVCRPRPHRRAQQRGLQPPDP